MAHSLSLDLLFPTYYHLFATLVASLLIGGYFIRRALLPKPIPGLLYKPGTEKKITGSGLELLAYRKEHGEMFDYVANLAVELNTPIFQMFVHPMGKSWVVVADNRETNDILTKRMGKDFDRSIFLGELLTSLTPELHAHLPTGDKWKSHRKLINDTMSPAFMNGVGGPRMWETTMKAIELWQTKARLAGGRAFSVRQDLRNLVFESIWNATFGFQTGALSVQADLLSSMSQIKDLPEDIDQEAKFPRAADPRMFSDALSLNDTLQAGLQSLMPKIYLWVSFNLIPSLRAARKFKETLMEQEISKAVEKLSKQANVKLEDESALRRHLKSAVDIVVARELESAKKESRAPDPLNRIVKDELFSFVLAGGEVDTVTAWALKFLTKHQGIQRRLRQELRDQLPRAADTGTAPTASEISGARLPYLDAVFEEALRCGMVTQLNVRTAQRDTVVLGHVVPKGTEVMMLNNGPGVLMPPIAIDEQKRSETSKASSGRIGEWAHEGVGQFDPTRWLEEEKETGRVTFNGSAGPRHAFGAGLRACFGRKWATLEFRMMLVLLIWHFELQPIPEALASFRPAPGIDHRPVQMFLRLKAIEQSSAKSHSPSRGEDSGVEF